VPSRPHRTYDGRVITALCPSASAVSSLVGVDMQQRPVDITRARQLNCSYLPVGEDLAMAASVRVAFTDLSNGFTSPAMVRNDEKTCDGKPRTVGLATFICHRSATPELGRDTHRYSRVAMVGGTTGTTECHFLLTDLGGTPLYVSAFTVRAGGNIQFEGDMSEGSVCGWLERIVELTM
jgi:hypothetical protein